MSSLIIRTGIILVLSLVLVTTVMVPLMDSVHQIRLVTGAIHVQQVP